MTEPCDKCQGDGKLWDARVGWTDCDECDGCGFFGDDGRPTRKVLTAAVSADPSGATTCAKCLGTGYLLDQPCKACGVQACAPAPLTDKQIDAAIESLFPNDNPYHAEWMKEVARPIARAILAAAASKQQWEEA